MNEKVKQVLYVILQKFQSGEIPKAVALASYPLPNVPSGKWSFINRTLMFLSGTGDARGIRQWHEAHRYPKRGSKAIYILVPCFKKQINDDTGEEDEVLRYFKAAPVFRMEDTEGELLDYQQIVLPELPLMKKAEEWGISIRAVPGNYRYYGHYSPARKEIALATPEETTFFHELSHAGHEKITGGLKTGQDLLQEVTAELSAQALCCLAGKQTSNTLGNSYQYIGRYAEKLGMTPYTACLKVLSMTEKILNLILERDHLPDEMSYAASTQRPERISTVPLNF